jgi:hypothetical protein
MLIGLWAVLRLCDGAPILWAIAGGSALGYGLLVRPLPGALFLAFSALYLLRQRDLPLRRRLLCLAAAAVPAMIAAVIFFVTNRVQTGGLFTTGYHAHDGGSGLDPTQFAKISASLSGAILRQHFWLLGWAVGLFFVFWARGRHVAFLWLLIGAELLYRVLAPKTVVGATGPIYMFEIVPLLCLLTAAGAQNLALSKNLVWSTVVCSIFLSLTCFVPLQVKNLRRSADTWLLSYRLLSAHAPALVFANSMVYQERNDSWAYFPPAPSPDFSDPILYVRRGDAGEQMYEFWKRRFPNRRAFVFGYLRKKAVLYEVTSPKDFTEPPAFLFREF